MSWKSDSANHSARLTHIAAPIESPCPNLLNFPSSCAGQQACLPASFKATPHLITRPRRSLPTSLHKPDFCCYLHSTSTNPRVPKSAAAMADQGAGDHSANTDTGTPQDAQFLPLQTDEQQHHHNGSDHNNKPHGDNNADLEAGYGYGYGTIHRGAAETTAAELWERQNQNRACFNSDVFFALVVTFALAAVALTWLTLSPVW
ncbi:hypothetical protein AC578_10735 [Pseudocercospora eumusae]|uniref:Uncharacterized protein n=1 Tax=Pseudocercospora eumusae TaxID=321146 RepID=A0A139H4C3_9PEZI|nr:hypothetical protein AC578_10735 [Pseudocercospora eumusae]